MIEFKSGDRVIVNGEAGVVDYTIDYPFHGAKARVVLDDGDGTTVPMRWMTPEPKPAPATWEDPASGLTVFQSSAPWLPAVLVVGLREHVAQPDG